MAEYKILSREGVNFVEVTLNDQKVRTERGAMRYIRGDITNGSAYHQSAQGIFT